MSSHTKIKLNETLFFYNKLQGAIMCPNEELSYYLSAFVAAANTVTLIMQKEFANKPGFKKWWGSHPTKKDYQVFRDLRTVILHQSTLKTSIMLKTDFGLHGLTIGPNATAEIPIIIQAPISTPITFSVKNAQGMQKHATAIQTKQLGVFGVREADDLVKTDKPINLDDFLLSSKAYLEFLRSTVNECELLCQ